MSITKSVSRWMQLRREDRTMLYSSLLLQAGIRVGLWLVPFSKVQRWASRSAAPKRCAGLGTEKRVVWAINTTSRLVPRCTCFVRALAAQVLFLREGINSELRVGIAKGDGALKGHAWLERDGRVLIGEAQDLSRYTLLNYLGGNKWGE